jgi:Holliday junction resolvasome RuvABC endonuclease subunit
LSECKGILLYELYRKNLNVEEIAIGRWKKETVYKGNASKIYVYEHFKNYFNIDLLEIFNLKLCKNGGLPEPISDIADSFSILMYMLNKKYNDVDVIGQLFD